MRSQTISLVIVAFCLITTLIFQRISDDQRQHEDLMHEMQMRRNRDLYNDVKRHSTEMRLQAQSRAWAKDVRNEAMKDVTTEIPQISVPVVVKHTKAKEYLKDRRQKMIHEQMNQMARTVGTILAAQSSVSMVNSVGRSMEINFFEPVDAIPPSTPMKNP